ncbi:hypothetical protein F4810DRAFT_46711 [Camillea tinctor]|nr:hypothetical protein F4810DRAFT_46711 [Camillea tinctor]
MGHIPDPPGEAEQTESQDLGVPYPSPTPQPLRIQARRQLKDKGVAMKDAETDDGVDGDDREDCELVDEKLKPALEKSPSKYIRSSASSKRHEVIASIGQGLPFPRSLKREGRSSPRSISNFIMGNRRPNSGSPLHHPTFSSDSPSSSSVPQRRGAIRRPGFSPASAEFIRAVGPSDDGPMGKARAPWADESAFIPQKREPRRAIGDLKSLVPNKQSNASQSSCRQESGSPTSPIWGYSNRAATGSSNTRPVSKFAVIRPPPINAAQTSFKKSGTKHGGPSTTFDDLLEKVSKDAPQSAAGSFPVSPAASLKMRSLTASARRGLTTTLKKGQEVITPKSPKFLGSTTKLLNKSKCPARSTTIPSNAGASVSHSNMRNPTPTGPSLRSKTKRALRLRGQGQWTRDPPSPDIPTGAQEIEEVERMLAGELGPHEQSPAWNLARHSWRSMELRTRWQHQFPPKAEEGNDELEASRVRWNRLEARRRVRVMSRVQDDFIALWEAWVSEQSAEVQAEAGGNNDNEQVGEGGRKHIVLRDPTKPTLKHYFDDCLIEVDEAFERQKNLAENLVLRNARRFHGMK